MRENSGQRAADIERIRNIIGRPETARWVFAPRVNRVDVDAFVSEIFSRLKVKPVDSGYVCDFAKVQPHQVTPFATQLWSNTITELTIIDAELGKVFHEGGGFVPTDPAKQALYNRKLDERFRFFVWMFGWGGAVGDVSNCFTARLLVLDNVIRIEDLQAKRNGQSGGWGLLDATVEATRRISVGTGQKVKTTATNDRVEKGFRRLGFIAAPDADLFDHSLNSRPLELPITPVL